jgi:monoamine oxidase
VTEHASRLADVCGFRMLDHCDVAIIGAGAAGIAAARHLAAFPLRTCVLEARDRIGGRAHTARLSGFPLDLGCGWLHSADENEWATIASDLALRIDRTAPPWTRAALEAQFPLIDQNAFRLAMHKFFERLSTIAAGPADCPASDLLENGSEWSDLIKAIGTYINGAELTQVSAIDFDRYHDTGVNYRSEIGFGSLITAYAGPMAAQLECPVTHIDHSNKDIRIETPRGTMTASAVVITIPTNVFAKQGISFYPPLPGKTEAASKLPLGLANKVFLHVTGAVSLPTETRFFGAIDREATGSYHIFPFGRPIIEGYFGGSLARQLERENALVHFAIEEVGRVLGADVKRGLRPIVATAWASEPFSLGSYSFATVGNSDARRELAKPVNDRLFFAGEACSRSDFSTAHGAYRTGLRAATEVLEALKATRLEQQTA